MRHTVIGLFETYPQAESARDTLVQTGFAREAIELQANGEPSIGSATGEVAGAGVLANIERFLSSLFSSSPRAAESARYAEAVRRGAVLVCVSAASESHAELARITLTRLGATDIGERSPDLDSPSAESRDHSMLDELGIGAMTSDAALARRTAPATAARPPEPVPTTVPMPNSPTTAGVAEPLAADPLDAAHTSIAAASAPGFGAVFMPSEPAPPLDQPAGGMGAPIPNEYLEYEEDFRSHFDEQYADDNSRYEDYAPAYRYGADIARDTRYQDRAWGEVEPEARRHWETTSPDSTWERFKLAIRHGWERVIGHHHV